MEDLGSVVRRLDRLESVEAIRDLVARYCWGADRRVRVAMSVHAEQALLRGAGSVEVVGGALARVSRWAPPPGAPGLYASPQVLHDSVRTPISTLPVPLTSLSVGPSAP